jgi:hypothetical protein
LIEGLDFSRPFFISAASSQSTATARPDCGTHCRTAAGARKWKQLLTIARAAMVIGAPHGALFGS